MTGGMTPRYAAPETFRGMVSRFSDQYSLAIVYQELLTGCAPFAASTPHEMLLAHTEGQPNLEPLSPADRTIVARALAKDPQQRHACCMDFVRELERGSRLPVADLSPPAAADLSVRPTSPRRSQPSLPAPATPPPGPAVTEIKETRGDGVLFPALVVGVGRIGLGVLRHLRAALLTRTVEPAILPHIGLLGIDTDPESAEQAMRGSPREALARDDVLLTPLSRVTRYLRPPSPLPAVEAWLPHKAIYRIPRNLLTGRSRALGRLAFVDHYRNIRHRLTRALERITALEALHTASTETGLSLRSNWPRVYVVASLGGGTGSGMFIDLAYTIRAALIERGYSRAEVVGLGLLPSAAGGPGSALAQANACAALVELRHFFAGEPFHAQYESTAEPVEHHGPPLGRTIFFTAPGSEGARDPAAVAGEYLYRELMTPLGREAEQARLFEPATLKSGTEPSLFRAVGMTVLASPGRQCFWYAVRRLGGTLLQRWAGPTGADVRASIREEIQEHFQTQGLSPAGILAALQSESARKLGRTLEDRIAVCLEPVTNAAALGFHDLGTLKQALNQVDRFLGIAEEEGALQSAQGPVIVREAAEQIGHHHHQVIDGLLAQYLDRPGYRLSGVVEAINQSVALLERALQMQESQVRDVETQVRQLGGSLRAALASASAAENAGKRSDRTVPLEPLAKTLAEYARVRCRHILLLRARGLSISLRGSVSDRMLEMRGYRQSLDEVRASLDDLGDGAGADGPQAAETTFEDHNPEEALDKAMPSLTADDWLQLDQSVQDVLQANHSSLSVALGSKAGLKPLRQVLVQQLGSWLSHHLSWLNDPVELFLTQHAEEQDLARELHRAFDAAAPVAGEVLPGRGAFSLLLAPGSAAGERLLQAARRALPETSGVAIAQQQQQQDEVVFYRECPELTFEELAELGLVCPEVYARACSSEQHTPHTRVDVSWQQPPVGD
jgi:hypothetical protein